MGLDRRKAPGCAMDERRNRDRAIARSPVRASFSVPQVPISQLARYLVCSAVNLSIAMPIVGACAATHSSTLGNVVKRGPACPSA